MSADFIDTNVLVYSFDEKAEAKRVESREILRDALRYGSGVISYQVIQEFLSVATGKFEQPLTAAQARKYLDQVLVPICHVWPNQELFAEAISIRDETGYSYYDSLIVAAALSVPCRRLLSEDLQSGRVIRGLEIVNPFA